MSTVGGDGTHGHRDGAGAQARPAGLALLPDGLSRDGRPAGVSANHLQAVSTVAGADASYAATTLLILPEMVDHPAAKPGEIECGFLHGHFDDILGSAEHNEKGQYQTCARAARR